MAQRLVDLRVPTRLCEAVRETIHELDPVFYEQAAGAESVVFRLVLAADKVEAFLDQLSALADDDREPVRAVVLPVSAMFPRAEEPDEAKQETDEKKTDRISREELHHTLSDSAKVTPAYVYMTILSAIVAAIGLSRDSAAVVIGAMVIAPLLGPNMALALATTLADGKLAARSLTANATGLLVAGGTACIAGLVWSLDPSANEIASRTSMTLGEFVLALASGAAGALAVTRGAAQSLVGVMVAVSLLPPLVIAVMLLVQGHAVAAGRAGLLVFSNVVCLNLAAIAVFRLRGIRPRTWWDDARAGKATLIAVIVWLLLLGTLAALVVHTGVPLEEPAPAAGT